MENNVFINVAIDSSIKKYNVLKETNDYSLAHNFLVYAIGVLIYIYGEENVLGLYEKNDTQSFEYLLSKYNVEPYYVTKFINDFEQFYNIEIRNKALNENRENPYFIYIQEDLINMYLAKYNALKFDIKKLDKFKDMLYTPINNDSFMQEYNQRMTDNQDYILNYYESKVNDVINPLEFTLERNNVLSDEIYESFGLTKEKREKLSFKELEGINNKIYNYFKVSPIEPNVNEKLLEIIKKHDLSKINKRIIRNSKVTNLTIFVIILLIIISITIFVGIKIVGAMK